MNVHNPMGSRFHYPRLAIRLGIGCFALMAMYIPTSPAQMMRLNSAAGAHGGRLRSSLRAEPKTLNPAFATDISSRALVSILHADLLHINRKTDVVEPALARSWEVSHGGQTYTLHLRRGIHFSDGRPFNADDVLFSFRVYLDINLNAPQRDLLIIDGHPIQIVKVDPYTVRFDLPRPYAAAARLFDGLAILPSHLLEPLEKSGKLKDAWTISTPPAQLAGLGPFRLKSYRPGEALTFERNPYYWKQDPAGNTLPYLDEVDLALLPNQDAESIRFSAGQTDLMARLNADSYASLERQSSAQQTQFLDAGAGLEFDFLLFNLNADVGTKLPEAARTQKWFSQVAFRQALSLAINRDVLVNLVFQNHAVPLASPITPASREWADPTFKPEKQDLARSRDLLSSAGFRLRDGLLYDRDGNPVSFTILAPSSNRQRNEMASMLRQQFAALGIDAQVVSLEFRSLLQRVTQTHDYDTAVMGLSAGDTYPNGNLSLWLSDGSLHLWNLAQPHPSTSWEGEIDDLVRRQLYQTNPAERRKTWFRVQQIYRQQLPFLSLTSPDLLGAARKELTGVALSPLDPSMFDSIAVYYWKK
jgi:peptide/nickel transport system substrate-binding protein